MNQKLEIKLSYVLGLRDVVIRELKSCSWVYITREDEGSFYIRYIDNFILLKKLRSISRVYLVVRDFKYNPLYISNHKSVLGDLIKIVINKNKQGLFKTFKVYCAGSNSQEVSEINSYIESNFSLVKSENVDTKIHIVKIDNVWEVGLQITPRPLSLREYKIRNMSGAMDTTIAYSMNYLCGLDDYSSYLNIFSGSATLMIEAGLCYPNLKKIVGFDIEKEYLSISIQNIKKAGLIRRVNIEKADIFDKPNLGRFDIITSDLPFGMAISKNEDIEKLYRVFIEYSQEHLNSGGKLAVYTSEFKIFEGLVSGSLFKLEKEIEIQLVTSEEEYLPVKILVYSL